MLFKLKLSGAAQLHNADGPRYAGTPPPHIEQPRLSDTLRIGSFNIEYALRVDSALAVLTQEPKLQNADVVLLQEMDAPATRYIARMLGMWFVYYPATLHLRHKRDFGNAVLSRWPITEDAKISLPHHARFSGRAAGPGARLHLADPGRAADGHRGTAGPYLTQGVIHS